MAKGARPKTLYEKLEELPEGLNGEIIDGQLYTEPRPRPRHALAASNLGAELIGPYARGRGGPGGWWIIDEPEVHFAHKNEVVVPDLGGWRRERLPVLPDDAPLQTVPDRVCEMLSPSTPKTYTLETYELRAAELILIGTFGPTSWTAPAPFEAVRFRLADVWT